MAVLLLVVSEIVDGLRVATVVSEGLGQLGGATKLKHFAVLGVLDIVWGFLPPGRRRGAVDGRDVAKGQVFDLILRDDAVLLKRVLAVDLEGEHDAQVIDVVAGQQVAVSFGVVPVAGPVEFPPVQAQHGHHLDEVTHGRRGVRLPHLGGHNVPALPFRLHGRDDAVLLPGGHLLGQLPGTLWALLGPVHGELVLLPRLTASLHCVERLEHDEPVGALVVSRVDFLALPLPVLHVVCAFRLDRGSPGFFLALGSARNVP